MEEGQYGEREIILSSYSQSQKELNPLAIARETVKSKVNEIQKMTSELSSNSQMSINPLSMLLKGVIDAAVMGGISNYDKVKERLEILSLHTHSRACTYSV